jgi:hypothetical protein
MRSGKSRRRGESRTTSVASRFFFYFVSLEPRV